MDEIWVEVFDEARPWKTTKIETRPGWSIGDIVEEARCRFKFLDENEVYGLKADKKAISSLLPVRCSGLFSSQRLSLYKIEVRRVKVRLLLVTTESIEFSSSFDCNDTIWEIMSKFTELHTYMESLESDPDLNFTCLLLGKTLDSSEKLKKTTLKDMGCVLGNISIRLIIETKMDNISKKHNTTVGGNIRSARSSTDELKHVAAPVKQTSAGDDEIKDQKPKELTVDEMEQILSLEPEDRKIKIFRIGKHPSSLTEEYDDNFYDLTTEDIKAMIKQQKIIEKTIRSDAFLSEEAKRKRLLNSKLNPPSITVRIKLADLYVIQAEFRILEQVSKLYELAREYTTIGKDSNFKLIVPPKNILNQGVTFLESGIKSNMSVLFNGGIFPAVKEEYRSKIIDFEPMPDCSYNLARRVEEDVANDTNYQGSNREARGNLLKKTLGCSNPTVKSNRLDNPGRKKKNVPSWFKAIKK